MTSITLQRAAERRQVRDPRRAVWEEQPTHAGRAGKSVALLVVLAIIIVPIYSVVITSFSTQASINIAGGLVLVPHGLTLAAYDRIFHNQLVVHSLVVSFGVTAIGTLLSMGVTILCAYGLSKPRSFGHRTILMLLVVTMFFNGGLIPNFLLVSWLGGYGQYWSMVLPAAISVFNILVMRGFFASQRLMSSCLWV